jgi:hypothetical protein
MSVVDIGHAFLDSGPEKKLASLFPLVPFSLTQHPIQHVVYPNPVFGS